MFRKWMIGLGVISAVAVSSAHQATFQHPIWSFIPVLNRLLAPSVETPGDTYTVNRGTGSPSEDDATFPDIHAAGLRFAIH